MSNKGVYIYIINKFEKKFPRMGKQRPIQRMR